MKLIKRKILAIAITISLVFCAELTIMGYTKFIGILSGVREKYIDFPNNVIRWRINFEFIFLNIIYVFWILQKSEQANFFCFSRILK